MTGKIRTNITLWLVILGVVMYLLTFITPTWLTAPELDNVYYNLVGLMRFFFLLGFTDLVCVIYKMGEINRSTWILKWLLIYLTGFQLVRTIFNYYVGANYFSTQNDAMVAELIIYAVGLAVTIVLAIIKWENDSRNN